MPAQLVIGLPLLGRHREDDVDAVLLDLWGWKKWGVISGGRWMDGC